MPANSSTEGTGTEGLGSKGAFVRSLPAETSTKDVIAKAKELGMTLTDSYVYKIRQAAKKPVKKAPRGKPSFLITKAQSSVASEPASQASTTSLHSKAAKPALMVNTVRISADDPHEQAIIDAMLVIGINRARSVIESVARLLPA